MWRQELEWTDEQKAAAFYCAETLRALTELGPKDAKELLGSRGKNAVAHAAKAGLFKVIDAASGRAAQTE